jgi:signal transduction histidine kinase
MKTPGHPYAARPTTRPPALRTVGGMRTDIALGLATAAVVAAAGAAKVSEQRPAGAAVYAFALALGALMLLRRRWPVTVLVVSCTAVVAYYSLGFAPIGLALPVGAALYSAAEAGRLRAAVGIGAALLAVATVARVCTGESAAYVLGFDLPMTAGLMAAAVAFGDGRRSRRRFRDAVLAAAAADREHRVEQERLRVARDVHDVLAHTMSVVTLHADVAAEALDDADVPAARSALGHIRAASGDAGRELRRTVGMLRDVPAAGGVPGIRALAGVSAAAGLPVRVRVAGACRELPGAVDEAMYRVVQEAVTNARRHARPDRVDVLVDYGDAEVRVVVGDDGPPSGAPGGAGQGLIGMRERVAALGGTLDAGPRPAGGWRVTVVWPA